MKELLDVGVDPAWSTLSLVTKLVGHIEPQLKSG